MGCIPAPTCKAALAEATKLWPLRDRSSDGICASPQHHSQNPGSDHETGEAWDLTHDPASGCDVYKLFAGLTSRKDLRVKYLILNRQMLRSYDKSGIPAWTWAPYSGSNPHTKHGHCSIWHSSRDDVRPWFLGASQGPQTNPNDWRWDDLATKAEVEEACFNAVKRGLNEWRFDYGGDADPDKLRDAVLKDALGSARSFARQAKDKP